MTLVDKLEELVFDLMLGQTLLAPENAIAQAYLNGDIQEDTKDRLMAMNRLFVEIAKDLEDIEISLGRESREMTEAEMMTINKIQLFIQAKFGEAAERVLDKRISALRGLENQEPKRPYEL